MYRQKYKNTKKNSFIHGINKNNIANIYVTNINIKYIYKIII